MFKVKILRQGILALLLLVATGVSAQVGDHRNDFALGVNGG